MDTMPRCQDCGGSIELDKGIGGRRAGSIQFCERCTKRHGTLEAAERRRTMMLAIAAVTSIAALGVFLLARG
jgi:hypothetical protein